MFTYVILVFRKIFKALELSGQSRARRYLITHNKGAWK
jgi:hypothetical protein